MARSLPHRNHRSTDGIESPANLLQRVLSTWVELDKPALDWTVGVSPVHREGEPAELHRGNHAVRLRVGAQASSDRLRELICWDVGVKKVDAVPPSSAPNLYARSESDSGELIDESGLLFEVRRIEIENEGDA